MRLTNPVPVLIVGMFTLAVLAEARFPRIRRHFSIRSGFVVIVPVLFHDVKSGHTCQLKGGSSRF